MKLLILILATLATTLQAQSDFHAYAGMEDLLEGGRIEKLSVVTGGYMFNIRPPRGWSRQVDEAGHKIIFTSGSGQSAITVLFSTNSPGRLPEDDVLRDKVLRDHPGAGIVQESVCPTSYKPGKFFDLTLIPAPHVLQRIRHAFAAHPGGEVEFILTASDDEYNKDQYIIMAMTRAFRADPAKPKGS